MEKLRHGFYLKQLESTLTQPQPVNVLDIGCALSDFTQKAFALNPSNRFSVMDTARNAIAWVEHQFPDFNPKVGTLPDIPFDAHFDVVLCLEVLCYLDPDGRRESMRQIHKRLMPSGIVMFSGVLDSGERYHSRDEVLSLIGEFFEIELVAYNYWRVYKQVLETPLDALNAAIDNLQDKLDGSAAGPMDHEATGRRARVLKMLAPTRALLMPVLRALSRAIRWAIGLRFPAELAQSASRRLGFVEPDEIIILGRKKGGSDKYIEVNPESETGG